VNVSLENRQIRATAGRQLLENPLFIEVWEAVEKHLHMATMACEPENKDKAQRIVISQQLLAAVKREVTRIVQDGQIAEVQMRELETKRSIFRR
jgi:hypothetical protein